MVMIEPRRNADELHGIPVVQSVNGVDVEAVIIACAETPQKAFDDLIEAQYSMERALTPDLLRISRRSYDIGDAK